MKFNVIPHITTKKISKERVFQLVRVALYTLFFTAILIHLNEFDNQTAETTKTTQALIVLIFFMLFLFALQKVKFLNIPSLVVTLVYAPIAVFQCLLYASSPDLLINAILEPVVNWLAFLLIADMIATKRVRKWQHANLFFFGFFALVTVFLLYQRPTFINTRGYMYFLLLFLVKTDDEEWSRVVGSILNAGVLSFAIVCILSFVLNPQFIVGPADELTNLYEVAENDVNPSAGGRWYGYFLNIGTFGQFLGLQTALAFLSIIRSKERFGRLSLMYFLSLVWMGGVQFIFLLVGTSDYLLGVFMLLVTVLVFGFKKNQFPRILIRALVMIIVLLGLGIGMIEGVEWVLSPSYNPATIQNIIDKTPLHFFPAGADVIMRKLTNFHELRQINGAFISSPTLLFLNYLGATRPAIWRVYLEYTTFHAGDSTGLPYQRFFNISAHNQYIQTLFNNGYFVGGLNILLFVSGFIGSIVGYVKTKTEKYFVPMVLFPVMLGMWVGERSTMFYALTFITIMCFFPLMSKYRYTRPDCFSKPVREEEDEEEEETEESDSSEEEEFEENESPEAEEAEEGASEKDAEETEKETENEEPVVSEASKSEEATEVADKESAGDEPSEADETDEDSVEEPVDEPVESESDGDEN